MLVALFTARLNFLFVFLLTNNFMLKETMQRQQIQLVFLHFFSRFTRHTFNTFQNYCRTFLKNAFLRSNACVSIKKKKKKQIPF